MKDDGVDGQRSGDHSSVYDHASDSALMYAEILERGQIQQNSACAERLKAQSARQLRGIDYTQAIEVAIMSDAGGLDYWDCFLLDDDLIHSHTSTPHSAAWGEALFHDSHLPAF
jgi:hypothetical protein